jgi:hypothetical protein
MNEQPYHAMAEPQNQSLTAVGLSSLLEIRKGEPNGPPFLIVSIFEDSL